MTYMVPNRFKHLTLGQPTSKQRLIRATHGLVAKQGLLVKTTTKISKDTSPSRKSCQITGTL